MPVFFIRSEQISKGVLHLEDPLSRHLAGSLRCKVGERFFVVDEHRVGYLVEVQEIARGRILAKVLRENPRPADGTLNITLAQAVVKGKKWDWLLQKAAELGVSRIIPITTERTVVHPKSDRIEAQQGRWREILRAAAQQSGRWDIPEVDLPCRLEALLRQGGAFDLTLLPWEKESRTILKSVLKAHEDARKILILIGPEGGFSEQEVSLARKRGAVCVSLGPRTLRAETAGVVALALLQYELGDLGESGDGA